MLATKEQIKDAALKLDPEEREVLAEELLLSLNGPERKGIDEAWRVEIRRRDELFRKGLMGSKPTEEVLARLEKKGRQ